MIGGMISHNTCNTDRKTGWLIARAILCMAEEKGVSPEECVLFESSCLNHLRHAMMDNAELFLDQKLEEHLKHDLDLIPSNLHVTCRLSELLILIDKE